MRSRPHALEQPVVRWSVVGARRAHGRRAAGRLRLAAVGARATSPPRACGTASAAPPACRRTGATGAAAAKPAARSTQRRARCARWRAPAPSDAGRPRRHARAAAMHDVPRRAGHERRRRAEPRGPVSRGRHQAAASTTSSGDRAQLDHAGARAGACPTATSATSPPTTPRCRRRAPRPTTYDEALPALVRVGRSAAQHRALHRPATAASTRSSARRGSKACRRTTSSRSSPRSRRASGATTATRRCATWRAAMTAAEIDDVAEFYARQSHE